MGDQGKLVAVIGDEDTVTGFVLAGTGHRNVEGCNFLVVKADTEVSVIEETFTTLTQRDDIGILLIRQWQWVNATCLRVVHGGHQQRIWLVGFLVFL